MALLQCVTTCLARTKALGREKQTTLITLRSLISHSGNDFDFTFKAIKLGSVMRLRVIEKEIDLVVNLC